MSDLQIAVRLQADGSGLVGQLKLSKDEVDRLKGALGSAATEAGKLADATGKAGAAADKAGRSSKAAADETRKQADAADALGRAQAETATRTRQAADAAETLAAAQSQATARVQESAGAVRQEAAAVEQLATAVAGAAGASVNLGAAQNATAGRVRETATAVQAERTAVDQLAASIGQAATASAGLGQASVGVAGKLGNFNAHLVDQRRHLAQSAQEARTKQVAMAGLGQQIGDVTQGLALGVNPAVVFGQQIGQIAFSAQGLGGKLGAVATFLSGPWGAALTGAVIVLGLMAEGFLDNEEAAKKSKQETDLHKMSIDELRDAIDQQRDALVRSIQTGREAEEAARDAAQAALDEATGRRKAAAATIEQAIAQAQLNQERIRVSANDPRLAGTLGPENNAIEARIAVLRGNIAELNKAIGVAGEGVRAAEIKLDQRDSAARLDPERAATERLAAAERLLNEERRAGRITRAEYGRELDLITKRRDAEVAAIRRQREEQTRANAADRQAGRQIDLDEARRIVAGVGGTVTSGLRTAERNRAVGGQPNSYHLVGQALDIAKSPGLTLNRIVKAFEDQGVRIIEKLDEGDHFHLAFGKVGAAASAAAQAVRDFKAEQAELARDLEAVTRVFDPAAAAAANYAAELARIDRLEKAGQLDPGRARDFRLQAGFTFDEQQAAASAARLKAMVDRFGPEWKAAIEAPLQTGGALDELVDGAQRFGQTFREEGLAAARDIADLIGRQFGGLAGDALSLLTGDVGGLGQSRTGRVLGTVLAPPQGIATDPFAQGLEEVFAPIRDGLDDLLGGLTTLFGEQGSFAKALGRYAANATLGGVIGPGVGGLFGGKQSSLGGSLGGAVGGELGKSLGPAIAKSIGGELGKSLGSAAGPIGAIAGSILGSVIGGALKSSKRGSATITGTESEIATRGNSGQFKAAASGSARTVQDALRAISEQLGGGLGDFAVSIGVRDGKFRVDEAGQGRTKTKAGAVDFGEDERGAISFAIADAIADGAVTGLSDAVQRALRSNSDVDRALREALKVDELETLLKGTGGEIEKAFRDFERQAAERRRIATQYGFDVVELEKRTAADRLKLFEDTVKSRVGALQDVLDDLDFGDLFEGSIAEQREKLLVEVAKAEAAARAGTAGAADRVADLRRQLLDVSKEGFGTFGGELAADRASTRTAAEEIIRLENDRVKAAQDAQLAANAKLDTGNQLADETNNLLAENNAILRAIAAGSGGGGGGGRLGFAGSTAREVLL